ncbi:hypothetical protein CSC3H3_06580 [Thalassospira marina]|uniref:Uncharacterized protein n=1 Tax=Thalassospira marina TaxID=2048283 RepID=A0ABM6Q7G8_9PROT|nr:hypothetical protein CSC3H3_06580 [Thalassospira marina]
MKIKYLLVQFLMRLKGLGGQNPPVMPSQSRNFTPAQFPPCAKNSAVMPPNATGPGKPPGPVGISNCQKIELSDQRA